MTHQKRLRLESVSTQDGIIAALAMDQRLSLRKMIASAAGAPHTTITDAQIAEFKAAVAKVLTPHTSAVLLDPEYGLNGAAERHRKCGLLMTYEADGFENPRPHRMLALMPHMSVLRIREHGAAGVKILLSWAPDDDPAANDHKRALIERIGAECDALDMPFFLEPVVYDPAGADPKSTEFLKRKPEAVVRTMEEFSKPKYLVSILKVEFPVGAGAVGPLFSRAEALEWYRRADAAASCPYIYLSAGVGIDEFTGSLELAAESGARFSGVLCGRATWQGGVQAYAKSGCSALEDWLAAEGVRNVQAINDRLRRATAWYAGNAEAAAERT